MQHCKTSRNYIRDFLLFRGLWKKQPDKNKMQIASLSLWRTFYLIFISAHNIWGVGVLRHTYRTLILLKDFLFLQRLTSAYSLFVILSFLIQSNQFLVISFKSLLSFLKATHFFYSMDYSSPLFYHSHLLSLTVWSSGTQIFCLCSNWDSPYFCPLYVITENWKLAVNNMIEWTKCNKIFK